MALENSPVDARGLMSGILQQGYSFGYVLAACANYGVGGDPDSWKWVFWVGAGFSIAVGLIRILFPESPQFIEAKKVGANKANVGAFFKEVKIMMKQEWRLAIYCIILMTWFNCETSVLSSLPLNAANMLGITVYSHTSQDSYTTFMLTEKQLDNSGASRASILMKTGACVGGTIIGYISQWFGRRRTIVVAAIMSMLLIPAWILPRTERDLSASGFFMQFFVQGAWGVIPIHLNELSPPQFRSSFPGLTYQIGNMISSPSAQIVNAISESNFITSWTGKRVEAYGPTMGIATAIIATGIAVWTGLGPEKRGRHFETALPAGVAVAEDLKVMDLEDGLAAVESKKHQNDHIEEKKEHSGSS